MWSSPGATVCIHHSVEKNHYGQTCSEGGGCCRNILFVRKVGWKKRICSWSFNYPLWISLLERVGEQKLLPFFLSEKSSVRIVLVQSKTLLMSCNKNRLELWQRQREETYETFTVIARRFIAGSQRCHSCVNTWVLARQSRELARFLLCIQQVPASNLGPKIG
jgi:hypothetical protein